jgi:uncharacterized protein
VHLERALYPGRAVLIRFRVENHRSIRDEQELSLVAAPLSEHPESLVRAERYDLDLLRVAAIYGANASGKSTVLNALSFMRDAVVESQRHWEPDGGVPREPFGLNRKAQDDPSLFAVDLLIDDVRYEYGFVVDSVRVLEEWLYAYPKGKRQEWFTREADREHEFSFSRLFTGENRSISSLTRPNSLFLSAAAQNNHESLTPIYRWFSQSVEIVDESIRSNLLREVIQKCQDERYRTSLFSFIAAADIGITRFDVVVDPPVFRQWTVFGESVEIPFPPRERVQLWHGSGESGQEMALDFDQESLGTQTLFVLAGLMVESLTTGGVLVIDELDRSLHPHLAMNIVSIFNDPGTNPHNAQLFFNTHDTNLLDRDYLRRDQIWFTEKGNDGATRLFPLTDFRARKYENLERGYLQGRYGAVPSVRTPDLRLVAEG